VKAMEEQEVKKILGERPVLLVIDVQHDFIDADGAVPCPATSTASVSEMVLNVRKLVDAAQAAKIPTIFTKEIHRVDMRDMGRELDGDEPQHCLEGTKGPIILDEVLPGEKLGQHQYLVPKRRYSAFVNTDIMTLLNGFKADTLILTGAATNVCVHYTGADAHQYDFKIRVVEEATAGTNAELHESALKSLNYLQHGARISINLVLEAMKNFRFPH
jgi:nicotinamidase-related amidase